MSKEAMKLALDAAYLAGFNASGEGYNGEYPFGDHARNPEEDAAWIKDRDNALREALAKQPAQQEPVAWMDGYRNIYSLEEKAAGCAEATIALVPMANQEKTSGSPINELQCVCGAVWLGEEMVHLPDKRPPAQRTWVGLTDEQWQSIADTLGCFITRGQKDAIEATIGIKGDA